MRTGFYTGVRVYPPPPASPIAKMERPPEPLFGSWYTTTGETVDPPLARKRDYLEAIVFQQTLCVLQQRVRTERRTDVVESPLLDGEGNWLLLDALPRVSTHEEYVNFLREHLDHPNPSIREMAIRALPGEELTERHRALLYLQAILEPDEDLYELVREQLAAYLKQPHTDLILHGLLGQLRRQAPSHSRRTRAAARLNGFERYKALRGMTVNYTEVQRAILEHLGPDIFTREMTIMAVEEFLQVSSGFGSQD